ncbi:MAG: NfeD family protein [Acidimicrobiales bacterium]
MNEGPLLEPPLPSGLHGGGPLVAVPHLRRQGGVATPDVAYLALARRISVVAGAATLALVVGAVLALSFLASAALPWVVGTVLGLAVVGAVAAGVHAGGHGWFVPLPVLVLAGTWGVAVSSGSWSSPGGWVLAVLAFAAALVAVILVLPAIAYRHAAGAAVGSTALVGAPGVALSALSPSGIARVNNETWTAESLSGPLPAGAPVHVAKVQGVRLLVWSEAGNVPGPEALGQIRQPKEEA